MSDLNINRNKFLKELEEIHAPLSYRSNENLKDGELITQMSEEHAAFATQEIIKCRKDPVYFAKKYYTIISLDKGKHIIKPYPKQEDLIRTLVYKNRVAVLAARQTGKTTSYCIFAAWMVCFNYDKKILILANKFNTALEIMDRIKLAFELLPKWLKPGIKEWNKGKIVLTNGCSIEGSATSSDAARSKSCNVLMIDEAAFVPVGLMNELWASAYPILSSSKSSKCVMVSTPNGTGNLFYTTYTNAILGKSVKDDEQWTPVRIDWWDVPNRDEIWKQQQIVSFNYDMRKFNQEFGNEFHGSTFTLVDIQRLMAKKTAILEKKLEPEDLMIKDYRVKIWERPIQHHCYVVGVDVADGTGNDYSVITVFDITEPTKGIKQVASFDNNKISPTNLSFVIAKVGTIYNVAPLMIESNNMGNTVTSFLHTLYEYPFIASIGQRDFGIHSTNKLKIKACQLFRDIIDHPLMNVILHELNLFNQLEYFEKHTTANTFTYRAQPGNNDDHVLANVWALFLLERANLEYFYDANFVMVGMMEMPSYVSHFDNSWISDQNDLLRKIDNIYDQINTEPDYNIDEISEDNILQPHAFGFA